MHFMFDVIATYLPSNYRCMQIFQIFQILILDFDSGSCPFQNVLLVNNHRERGGVVVESRTLNREVLGSIPTSVTVSLSKTH